MNTIDFLQSFEAEHCELPIATRLSKMRSSLFSKGICWTDSVQGNFAAHDCFRVVLFLTKNLINVNFDNPLVTECNGLVLEYAGGSWRVLAMPMPNCTITSMSMTQVNKFYQEKRYQIYELLDATTVNMYHYDGSWRMSTCKGYDVTDLPFVNDCTYMQVFERLVCQKYCNFEMDQLDPECCYTVALRCSDFHLFDETKHLKSRTNGNDYIKLLKVTSLGALADINLEQVAVALPIYSPIEIKSAASVSMLMNYAKHAYSKYAKGFDTNNFKFKPLHGYVLRSASSAVPRAYKNIKIISSLFAVIKHGLYRKPFESCNHMLACMFTDRLRKEQFKILFDQYAPQFSALEAIAQVVCQSVTAPTQDCAEGEKDPLQVLADQVVTQLGRSVDSTELPRETVQSMAYDCLHSPDYIQALTLVLDRTLSA